MSASGIDITEISFSLAEADHNGSDVIVFRDQDIDWSHVGEDSGGSDEGGIAVRFLIDGQFNHVTLDGGATGSIAGIEYAISVLTRTLLELRKIPGQRPGRCLHQGQWGRCTEAWGHAEGEHVHPDEEAFNRSLGIKQSADVARAKLAGAS